MDRWSTYTWILLAIRPTATPRNDLYWRAEALNKAPATDAEIDSAVDWLQRVGIITVDAGGFARTAAGEKLVEEEWTTTSSMYDAWDRIAMRLRTLRG